MKSKKTAKSVTAVVLAAALALSGTFAWQSMSQQALNEAQKTVNPGGRLHDDFSGYNDPLKKIDGKTKDIYVENFGAQIIYARVRLDEYMEIGDDANLMDTKDANYATRNATSLVAGAKKEDVTTWTTHLPDQDTPETDLKPQDNPFHKYWTWTMGGQDPVNPDGQTVYMPTFNQNKDSLQADINGSWENERNIGGTLKADGTVDKKGDPFSDYRKWEENGTETGVYTNTVDNTKYTAGDEVTWGAYERLEGEIVDADTNDVEEAPISPFGNSGAENTNWKAVTTDAAGNPIQHTAKKTETGSVISMQDWLALTDAEKNAVQAWVYDADGWAYWSQPIEPGTATGLLLDSVELTNNPYMNWYYGINAVGQFITKDDMGRKDNTGFYDPDGGENPSEDALKLLDYIGVNTSSVTGTVTTTAKFTDAAGEAHVMKYVVPGMQKIELNSTIGVPGNTPDQAAVEWKVTGARSANTKIVAGTGDEAGKWFLNVGADEPVDSVLLLTAASTETAYAGLNGKLRLPVEAETYSVRLTAAGGVRSVLPGANQNLTATLVSNSYKAGLPQTFNWEILSRTPALKPGTEIDAGTGASKVLHVSYGETGKITVKATVTGAATGAAYKDLSGELTLSVTDVEYEMDLMDGNAYITDSTVSMGPGETKVFNIDLWSDPAVGNPPSSAWTWESSNPAVATVDQTGKVTILDTDGTGASTVISVKLTDKPEVKASFTLESWKPVRIMYGDTLLNDTTREIMVGESLTLTALGPTGYNCTWSSDNEAIAKVAGGVVTVNTAATPGATATITATATLAGRSVTRSATFTVKAINTVEIGGKSIEVSEYKDTVAIDGIDWYVVAVDEELHSTDGSTHRAALLLPKNIIDSRPLDTKGVNSYVGSELETWLNGEFLTAHSTIQSKALEVTLKADKPDKSGYKTTNNKVFLLSFPDYQGSNYDAGFTTEPECFAYNGTMLPNINKIAAATYNGSPLKWWTRSVGHAGGSMMMIMENGGYDRNNVSYHHSIGVRPAFWYNLES